MVCKGGGGVTEGKRKKSYQNILKKQVIFWGGVVGVERGVGAGHKGGKLGFGVERLEPKWGGEKRGGLDGVLSCRD